MDPLDEKEVLESVENVIETDIDEPKNINLPEQTTSTIEPPELTPGRKKLHSWLNRDFRIVMTDGRILTGIFLCTDADANVILGMCSEFTVKGVEDRILGLVMVPGRHIVSMEVDVSQ